VTSGRAVKIRCSGGQSRSVIHVFQGGQDLLDLLWILMLQQVLDVLDVDDQDHVLANLEAGARPGLVLLVFAPGAVAGATQQRHAERSHDERGGRRNADQLAAGIPDP